MRTRLSLGICGRHFMISDQEILDSKILIIEDELTNVLLLEKILHHEGYQSISSVTDPKQAVEVYKTFQPDLVLLDLNMPGMSGFEVMESLKPLETDSFLPVLVLTAKVDQETKLRAFKLGAKDFVSKPFDISEICSRIRNLLEVRLLHKRVQAQNLILEKKIMERSAELKASHDQLLHSEKLAAVGKLAASIAHEFNNPILGIRNILEQVSEVQPLTQELKELVGLAIQESTRVMGLASKLRQFYQPTSGEMDWIDIHSLLDDMLVLEKLNLSQKKATVIKHYGSNLPQIQGVEDQIKQVVLNLLQNAEEALGQGEGEIQIDTRKDGKKVMVQIKDNGCGIGEEELPRIFDPFYSTKTQVKGTGLGLSVSYGIVKQHGGSIECVSSPGEGSSFTLILPIQQNGSG